MLVDRVLIPCVLSLSWGLLLGVLFLRRTHFNAVFAILVEVEGLEVGFEFDGLHVLVLIFSACCIVHPGHAEDVIRPVLVCVLLVQIYQLSVVSHLLLILELDV